jgi:hypothetical protein
LCWVLDMTTQCRRIDFTNIKPFLQSLPVFCYRCSIKRGHLLSLLTSHSENTRNHAEIKTFMLTAQRCQTALFNLWETGAECVFISLHSLHPVWHIWSSVWIILMILDHVNFVSCGHLLKRSLDIRFLNWSVLTAHSSTEIPFNGTNLLQRRHRRSFPWFQNPQFLLLMTIDKSTD